MKKIILNLERKFELFTQNISIILGHSFTFFIAILIVVCWLAIDIIGSSSLHTLINDLIFSFTFLMVFILQKMQNKFTAVMNAKLNELVASHETASNRLIKAEDMTEEELRKIAEHYQTLSSSLDKNNLHISSGSIEHVLNDNKEGINKNEDQ